MQCTEMCTLIMRFLNQAFPHPREDGTGPLKSEKQSRPESGMNCYFIFIRRRVILL